jgi:hypothetical protein
MIRLGQHAFGLTEDKYGNYVVQVCQCYVLLELFPICVLTRIVIHLEATSAAK